MNKKFVLMLLTSLVMVLACVEPFDLNFKNQKEILFVEAHLNDLDDSQTLTIKKSSPLKSTGSFIEIEDANVVIIENKTKKIQCTSVGQGVYKLPEGFKIIPNTSYQMEFTLSSGEIYRSSEEKALNIFPIENLLSEFKKTGIDFDGKSMNGHEIYLNTKDDVNQEDYYMWQWKLYEKQGFCKSCDGGRYFTTPLPLGQCVDDQNLRRRGVTYDYVCRGDCWDIIRSSNINIMSDQYSNGLTINNRLIGEIPFLQFRGALVEVVQYGISRQAFEYFNIMISQSQNTGTLADTPPAGLVGNIKNIKDKTEAVGGIFMVSSKKTKTIWLPREESYPGITAYGLFNGRQPNPEPSGPDTTRPPLAPCSESKNRTAKKPQTWID